MLITLLLQMLEVLESLAGNVVPREALEVVGVGEKVNMRQSSGREGEVKCW